MAFLDLNVKLSNGSMNTDLHIKPTDRHQHLYFSSAHSDHTKRSIVYRQALRVSRICSLEKDFKRHTTEMKSWFLNRGYPEWLINKEIGTQKHQPNVSTRTKNKTQGVPLVITYHPLFKTFGSIIRKHLNIVYMNEGVKKVFSPCPIISFR